MEFSVLMPIYHGDKVSFIEGALDSILHQTLAPTEIVLVVDGPVGADIDNLLKTYNNENNIIKTFYLEINRGLGDALNFGVNQCSYDVIARMDADDISHECRFKKQVEFLKEHPEIDIVGSFIHEFATDPNEEGIVERSVPVNHFDIVQYSKRRNPMNHMTVMFRKKAVINAGNYQKYIGFEDYFLWVRMIREGAKFYNIPEALVFARTGDNMYKRRGGLHYLLNEVKLHWGFYKSKHIGFYQFASNVVGRSMVRIAPNQIRARIYKALLRK